MFLALRDLAFARGRFSLIIAVVALMTFLVAFLTGLTGGLAMQNISGLLATKADAVVFDVAEGESADYQASRITEEQALAWSAGTSGDVVPLGVSSGLLATGAADSEASEPVILFAAPRAGLEQVPAADSITLGATSAHALGVAAGDSLVMGGMPLEVAEVVPDEYYSHRLIAWIDLDTWHEYQEFTHQPSVYASALLLGVEGAAPSSQLRAALDAQEGTVTESFPQSLLAAGSFRSEIGSLAMMIAMLVLISTLVIGVFFLVWSMQRQRDIAVLKAVGASMRWLALDALGQALLVLALGALLGIGATAGLGLLAQRVMPFVMNATTLVAPPAAMLLAGVLGALVSLRTITRVDPNTALQASAA